MTVTTEQTPVWPWPTPADLTRSLERYLQFLQRQGDINRELAISWVAAVTAVAPTSRAIRNQTQGTRHPMAEHRDLVAEPAHARDDMTSDQAEAAPAERSVEQNLRRNDLFDGVIDGLINADIMATTPR
jgi:hypothetical protein